MRSHQDDRGTRYCDIFPEIGKGDINVTVVEPGASALWHRHRFQSDFQIVIKGSLKVGICNMAKKYSTEFTVDGNGSGPDFETHEQWKNEYYNVFLDAYCKLAGSSDIEYSDEVISFVEKYKSKPMCHWIYMSENNANQGPLFIPAGLWHGCYNYTNEQAILIYHITNKWVGTDEERCHPDIMGWNYEREIK